MPHFLLVVNIDKYLYIMWQLWSQNGFFVFSDFSKTKFYGKNKKMLMIFKMLAYVAIEFVKKAQSVL